MSMKRDIQAAILRSAAHLLRPLVEEYGPDGVVKAVSRALHGQMSCHHWYIREVIVSGSITEPTTGKVLKRIAIHERSCLNCRAFEAGEMAPDGKKKNVFKTLVRGPNRTLRTEDLRPRKG